MYELTNNLVIGYHGCDQSTCDQLINNQSEIQISTNPYDWLGNGFYFWENDYQRALDWALSKKKRGRIKDPAVVGAAINLGNCCDLLYSPHQQYLKPYYKTLEEKYFQLNLTLPKNENIPSDQHGQKLLRNLDCALIEHMHEYLEMIAKADLEQHGLTNIVPFDTIRCAFSEGGPLFEGSLFLDRSHIQICVRNLTCIKGFFHPRESENSLPLFFNNHLTALQN